MEAAGNSLPQNRAARVDQRRRRALRRSIVQDAAAIADQSCSRLKISRAPICLISRKRGSLLVSTSRGRGSSTEISSRIRARPPRQNDDAVAEQDGLLDVVGDQERGAPEVLPQPRQFQRQFLARQCIERPERLIEQQQLRIGQQRAAERGALLHAAREHMRPVARKILQAGQFQKPQRAFARRQLSAAKARRLGASRSPGRWPTETARDPGRRCRRRVTGRQAAGRNAACSPAVGASSPAISRSSVDLPQPDGPTTDTKLPASIARSSGPSAWTACSPLPNDFGDTRSSMAAAHRPELHARQAKHPGRTGRQDSFHKARNEHVVGLHGRSSADRLAA